MSARTRMAVATLLAAVACGSVGLVVSCKEEATRSVIIDLGIENRGSAGFGCLEELSSVCNAVQNCSLRTSTRDDRIACLNAACRDGGATAIDCQRLFACITGDGGDIPSCYDEICLAQPTLASRTLDAGASMHVYVDYVRLGGTPACHGVELRDWCVTHGCSLLRRRCLALPVDPTAVSSRESAPRAISEALAKVDVLDERAPNEPVVIRIAAVARSGPCSAEEEQTLDLSLSRGAIGCAHSCPVQLTSVEGAVTVDYDVVGTICTATMLEPCLAGFADDGGAR